MCVQTSKFLSKHAFKICDIDAKSSTAMTYNVRLLREVPPFCKDPYELKAALGPGAGTMGSGSSISRTREQWDQTCNMAGVGLGSMVVAPASSSTWKRKVTTY